MRQRRESEERDSLMVGGGLTARGWFSVYDFDGKADRAAQPRAGGILVMYLNAGRRLLQVGEAEKVPSKEILTGNNKPCRGRAVSSKGAETDRWSARIQSEGDDCSGPYARRRPPV